MSNSGIERSAPDTHDYAGRRERIYSWLEENDVDAVYLQKDADVRYLSGMPGDSTLLLFRQSHSVLLPWDINLAKLHANSDEIIPFTNFDRKLTRALSELCQKYGIGAKSRVEIPGDTAYPAIDSIREAVNGAEIVCRTDGFETAVQTSRSVKDRNELEILERAAKITNEIVDELEAAFRSGELSTELDVALFIERESRTRGGEGTGFDTIVAGPSRSNGIHAYPGYTQATFRTPGSGIIDFGVKVDGYTSDVTMSCIFGEPTKTQREMIDLVERAYHDVMGKLGKGADAVEIARDVDSLFEASGYSMPHSLGHGIGLEVHEAPSLRSHSEKPSLLEEGMAFTVEPGLYHESEGGVRFENDVIITPAGPRVITTSRILYVPLPG